jgi:hypothetical protein
MMVWTRLFTAIAALFLVSCNSGSSPNAGEKNPAEKHTATERFSRPENENKKDKTDGQLETAEQSKTAPAEPEGERVSVGRLSFSVLPGWELREAIIGDGLAIYAPDRDTWKELSFRPSIGVKIRNNPGMTLDDVEQLMRNLFTQQAGEVNKIIKSNPELKSKLNGNDVDLKDFTFELKNTTLPDGTAALTSVCDSTHEVNGKPIPTKTFSFVVLDQSNIYTVTFTILIDFESEFTQSWKTFSNGLRFGNATD